MAWPVAAQDDAARYGARMLAHIAYSVEKCGAAAPDPEKVGRAMSVVMRAQAEHLISATRFQLAALEKQHGVEAVCVSIKEAYR